MPSLFWQFEKFGAGKVFLLFADVAFGTGEGLLVYGMDARYRRGTPGVLDAFSEALRAQNRLLGYGMEIRCQKPPPTVRGAVHHFRRALHRKQPFGARSDLQRYSVIETPSCTE